MSTKERKKKSAILTNRLVLESMRDLMAENVIMFRKLLNSNKFYVVSDSEVEYKEEVK
jgi:hypothetical protein